MYKQTVDVTFPSVATSSGTVTSSTGYEVDGLLTAGVFVRLVSSELCKVQVFRFFITADTVPYKEFYLTGTRTISLPPGKYEVVFNKELVNTDVQLWIAPLQFILTEI